MKPEISIFIPVYKESKLLPKILNALINQRVDKEIFVIIDEPTQYSLDISKKFGKKIKFIINKKRIGKANALNNAVKLSSSEILLFLDADIEIPNDSNFLKKIIEEMKDADVLDIKKEVVKNSFLSKITYYEYVGFNIGCWLAARFIKKCPSVNGAAFAMKRDVFNSIKGFRRVVSEDLDIAMRAFLKNYKFKYTKKVKVYNHVHSNWKNWIVQRRRWSTGVALWFKEWYKDLLKSCAKEPQIFIPALFFIFPSLAIILINFLIPNMIIYKIISVFLLFLLIKFNFALPILLFTTLGINLLKSLLASILSFLSFSILFFIFSKKLEFKFKIHEFFFYYFFYSLVTLLFIITFIIKVWVFNKKSNLNLKDWKV